MLVCSESVWEIKGLFRNLLDAPLDKNYSDTFIILDGVDEADWKQLDCVDQSSTEMALLIRSLCQLTEQSIRLLFTTRPGYPVSSLYKSDKRSITKVIGPEQNVLDIRAYVKHHRSQKPSLQKLFEAAGIHNPQRFLEERSKGNFLWVVTLIKAIGDTETIGNTETQEGAKEWRERFE